MDITLDDFVAIVTKHLVKFKQEWRVQNAISPEDWPAMLSEGEWWEQFWIFDKEQDD